MALSDILKYIDSTLEHAHPSNEKCILFPISYSYGKPKKHYEIVKLGAKDRFSNLAISSEQGAEDRQVLFIATQRRLTGTSYIGGGATLAECLLHMDVIPKRVPVIIVDARDALPEGDMPEGLVLVYDDSGKYPAAPIVTAETLGIGKRGKLHWISDIPAPIEARLKTLRDNELRANQLTRIAAKAQNMFQMENVHNDTLFDTYRTSICKILSELSYGTLSLEECPSPAAPGKFDDDSAQWLAEHIVFDKLRFPSFEDYDGACDITRIFNLIDVWLGLEEKYGFSIRFSIHRNEYSGICELGKMIGADSAIMAVASGVLPEDVLA